MAAPRQGWRSLLEPSRLVGAAAILVGFLVWELYARSLETNIFIPTFSSTMVALVGLVQTPDFWDAYRQTLVPFVYGWISSLAVGVVVGLIIGISPTLRRLTAPYVAFFNALPVSVLVPVVVVAMGIEILARGTVVFLFGVFQVLLSTSAGIGYIGDDVRLMAKSFGMGPIRQFRRIILPGAMPGIMAGIRIGTGRAVVGMVVMELLLITVGVGRLVERFRSSFEAPKLYAVVFTLAVFGYVALAVMRRLETNALRWRGEA